MSRSEGPRPLGLAPPPTSPSSLAPGEVLALATRALLIRRVEERLLDLFKEGRIFGTVHTCLGQEFTGVAVSRALGDGDFVFSNHRCHGHYLAHTDDAEGLIAEVMGKANGVCGGRGGSQHLCKGGFYSNGVQGGIAPVAAGMAFARKLTGEGRIGAVFLGDGTLGEGTLYETLNLVSKWQLPLLLVLENNGYAQSTSQSETLAGDILLRAQSFGIAAAAADTWRWQELTATVKEAVDRVRHSGQPMFLRVDTYRLGPHSKGDDNRDPAEIAAAWKRDPLRLLLDDSDGEHHSALRDEDGRIKARLDRAVALADAAGVQSADTLVSSPPPPSRAWSTVEFKEERVVAAIRRALERALELDPRVVLLGEDIRSPYGGAFKATAGLSDRFPSRVVNTPISEAAIVGVGSGLALEGYRPIVEIMFGDFVLLAADQLVNHAAKFRWMYNDQVRVPLVVRTPMGGKRGYGPTHSQTLEKHLLGVPDLRVLALHPRWSPARVYEDLLALVDGPTLVIENKIMYGQTASPKVPPGFVLEANDAPFPTLRVRPNLNGDRTDMTIVAYGGMVIDAEEAMRRLFVDHELAGELIVPLQLHPLDLSPLIEAVGRSGKLLIVEEGQGFAGFGAELTAALAERGALDGVTVRRLAAAACPIPTSRPLEAAALPSADAIERAALELAGG